MATVTNNYTAVFKRDEEDFWLVELIEEPRVHTYGRTLAKARDHIREATALWFEVAPDAFILAEDIQLPKPVKATVDRARKQRAKAQAVQSAAADATHKAARALVEEGQLSVRDAADILGLSHQRVQQLLAS